MNLIAEAFGYIGLFVLVIFATYITTRVVMLAIFRSLDDRLNLRREKETLNGEKRTEE